MSRSSELLERLHVDEVWQYYDDIYEPSPILQTVSNDNTYNIRKDPGSPKNYHIYISGKESVGIQFTSADYSEFERQYHLKFKDLSSARLAPPSKSLLNRLNR